MTPAMRTTKPTQAETALRLENAAFHAAADAIVITDRAGTIERVNPAFTALTGYTAADALGKNSWDLVKSGKHPPEFFDDVWQTIVAGRTWRGETINRRKDGSLYTESQSVTPIRDGAGAIAHFVAIKSDVSGRLKLEARRLQWQALETAGHLAGGIAHDFNNVLTVINATAELAMMDLKEGDPLRADCVQIRSAGQRAALLTKQLLAFSRKQILNPEVLSLSTLIHSMKDALVRLIGEQVVLAVHAPHGVGNVIADSAQMEQVVTNLAVNARDAMANGGTLTIETQDVELDAAFAAEYESVHPGPHVMLEVRDTGSGMDEEVCKRIFEPFFTTKGRGKGPGLGLSTAYGIIKQSGGSIWVDSKVGRGTTFKIYLPRVEENVRAPIPVATEASVQSTETILIVDDEEWIRQLAKRILEAAGYSVLVAGGGDEALALLQLHRGTVHLLLTDVVMPGMTGLDLAAVVKEIRPQTKVLYTSGFAISLILQQRVRDEAMHFIGKPYTAEDLMRKVREALG